MLKYINKQDYIELLGVSSIPDNFDKLTIEASSYINKETFFRIDSSNPSEKVKYVTCLIVDLINTAETKKDEIGNLKSQNIEGWSETYSTPEEIDNKLENDKQEVLKNYLIDEIGIDGNPLLYKGVY